MEKLLSIIVPSYNMEHYLPKCLGSLIVDDPALLQQLDVIVVNDGSKDRTSEIAHEFEAKYPGVFRVIDKANGHYGSCINAGLQIADGLYVKILDADDWFDTSVFVKYLSFLSGLKDSEAVDLVVNDFNFLFGNRVVRKDYSFVAELGFDISCFTFEPGHDVWMHGVAYRTLNLKKLNYLQMTGITHTDVQWIHTPMATVTTVAYFHSPLYMYLADRQGNTSTPDAFYKTFHDLVAVTKKLVSEYAGLDLDSITVPQKTYMENHIRYRVMRVYAVYLLERSPFLRNGVLEEFDSFLLRESPWLYQETSNLLMGHRIKFRYVFDWRKKKKVSLKGNFLWFLQWQYGKIMGLIRRLGA